MKTNDVIQFIWASSLYDEKNIVRIPEKDLSLKQVRRSIGLEIIPTGERIYLVPLGIK